MRKIFGIAIFIALAVMVMAGTALATAGATLANCDQSCILTAQGMGKILVKVTYKGKAVTAGGLEDKVSIKVMTVEPKYMDFHDQGGLPVFVGRHEVWVLYPGHKTAKEIVFVKIGETVTVPVEIGSKIMPKAVAKKLPQKRDKCKKSDQETVDQPKGAVVTAPLATEPCEDCPSGQKIIVPLPIGNQQ